MPAPTKPPPSAPAFSSRLGLILGAALLAAVVAFFALRKPSAPVEADAQAELDAAESTSGSGASSSTRSSGEPSTLAPEWATASGRVESGAGAAIAGAVVSLAPLGEDAGEPRTVTTDVGGSWAMKELPAGRYSLSATAPGYLAGLRPGLTLRASSDNAGLDLSLERGGVTLSGVVEDKTGGVVEGALVQLTPQSGILRMRERESVFTLSDGEGRYAVQVPAGRQRVRASHTDYSSESIVLDFADQPQTQNFALVPTAVIEGVVVRESNGAAVAHADITWYRQHSTTLPTGDRMWSFERGGKVHSGPDGRFRVSGLPPGTIKLEARASRLASFEGLQVPVGIAERIEGVELPLAAASDVSGRVSAASNGEGIAGATVKLNSQMGGGGGVVSDDEGSFHILGVLPGSYRVSAQAEGFSTPDGPAPAIEVGRDAPSSVSIELEQALSIRGRVEPPMHAEVAIEFDAQSMQLGGGGMLMLAGAQQTQTESESGAFEIGPIKPGHYTLQARTADGRGGTVELDVGAQGADEVVIALEPRAVLVGRVEDTTGKVVNDVLVQARKRSKGPSLSVIVNGRELTALNSMTSLEGKFEVAGLEAGVWDLEVLDAQGTPLAMEGGKRLSLELRKGETRELLLRVEPRDGTITGIVRDAEGEPVTDAWVSAVHIAMPQTGPKAHGAQGEDEDEGGGERRMEMMVMSDTGGSSIGDMPPVLTGEDGRFRFERLRQGEYIVTAELDGGGSKASAEGVKPNADITLDLAPLGTIEGKVTSDNKPADCVARIMGPSERVVRVRDGAFEAERLEPGHYRVEVRTGDGATSAEVEVEAGRSVELRLSLERFATVTGTIVDESGAPVVGVEIMIGSGEGGRIEISREDGDPQYFTDEAGKFEAQAASGGRVLIAQNPGVPMPIVIKPFRVEPGKDVDLGELQKRDTGAMMVMEGGAPPGSEDAPLEEVPAED